MYRFWIIFLVALFASSAWAGQDSPVGEPRSLPLPAMADNISIAGGGRYLLIRFEKLLKVGVFDIAQDSIVGYISLPSAETVVAGGQSKIVLVARDTNEIQRWSIEPLEKELTSTLVAQQIDALAIGHASEGPLLVMLRRGPILVSLQTLQLLELDMTGTGTNRWRPHSQYPIQVAASADGQTFAGWMPRISPTGVRWMQLRGDTVLSRHEHASAGVLLPSWDGSLLFTSKGIYNADLERVDSDRFRGTTIPSLHPSYFVASHSPRPGERGPTSLAVYTVSGQTKLFDLDPLYKDQAKWAVPLSYRMYLAPQHDKLVFLAPQHNKLVILAPSRDRLVSRSFDIVLALNNAGIDYLFVDTSPPTLAGPGSLYRYPLQVRSKAGGVKFRLDSGPEAMSIADDGMVTWAVPTHATPGQHGVIISIEDASGQTRFHAFTIRIDEE